MLKNGTVTRQCGLIQIRHNIRWIKLYTYDKIMEDINPENIYDDVNILSPVIYFCITLKLGHKVYNWMIIYALMLIHIGCAH